MTNPNFEPSAEIELATAEQAQELLQEIGKITTLHGKNCGDRNTYGNIVVATPDKVAEHLPQPTSTSSAFEDSIYITQQFDRATGQPLRKGVVGMVTFTRNERVDTSLTYATRVNYHITTQDGETFGMERHVTNTEHGPHKAQEMRRKRAQMAIDPLGSTIELLAKLESLKSRIDTTRPIEQAMCMFDVTKTEAKQVTDYICSINELGVSS